MIPTLEINQRVLVNRMSYHFGDPGVGDIVVFNPPLGAADNPRCGTPNKSGQACSMPIDEKDDENFIKRVVAVPGDTLKIEEGYAVVNGVRAEESFIKACKPLNQTSCNMPKEITIPPDHYFMLGDNRGSSDDSRFWGPVPRDWIIGKAFATYWPPNRVGIF